MSAPWYTKAFEATYLLRYAHRSDEAAAQEVRFLLELLKLPPESRLLDYCCGAGRHSRAFAKAGLNVTGFDLSAELLRHAMCERSNAEQPEYVQADMRYPPFKDASFDAVTSLFTSFGYFETDEENAAVLGQIARVLKPGGRLVLDFLNIVSTQACLIQHSQNALQDLKVLEWRTYDEARKRLEKKIHVESAEGVLLQEIEESVRAFTRVELMALLTKAGLSVYELRGDLSGAGFSELRSPRCVFFARKP